MDCSCWMIPVPYRGPCGANTRCARLRAGMKGRASASKPTTFAGVRDAIEPRINE